MTKELVLRYHPEKVDYVKASRTLAMKTTTFIIVGLVLLVMVVASVLVLSVPSLSNGFWRSAAFVSLAMGAFYIINFWLIIPYQLSKAYKRNQDLQKERKLTISDSGITMQIGDRATVFSWENFQRVLERDHFYLMIYKAEERVYPFIPKRAFLDGAFEEDFLAVLAEKSIPVK